MSGLTPAEQAHHSYAHYIKYKNIADALGGYDVVAVYIPSTPYVVKACLLEDEHLNNIPLKHWNMNAHRYIGQKVTADPGDILRPHMGEAFRDHLTYDPNKRNWRLSLAEVVCVLKHVAIYHPEWGAKAPPPKT